MVWTCKMQSRNGANEEKFLYACRWPLRKRSRPKRTKMQVVPMDLKKCKILKDPRIERQNRIQVTELDDDSDDDDSLCSMERIMKLCY